MKNSVPKKFVKIFIIHFKFDLKKVKMKNILLQNFSN